MQRDICLLNINVKTTINRNDKDGVALQLRLLTPYQKQLLSVQTSF